MSDSEEIPTLVERNDIEFSRRSGDLSSRVPLTIICGFLGAGKSTLLKRILTERHGYRIAVIVNEFGDTADIEAKAINISSHDDPTAENSEEFLELANGCLCCSIKDSGVAAIEKLMQRKGAFDYILLETTGLADPGPIASMFWHNEEFATGLGQDIVLDGVICVVDAVFGKQQMEEDHDTDRTDIGESFRQIAGSDVILLNKVDLASPDSVREIEALIHQVNPAAPLYKTTRGEIKLEYIMGISAYTLPPHSQSEAVDSIRSRHVHSDECEHDHLPITGATHYGLRGISSLQVSCPILSQAMLEKLDEWIRSVLWENRLPGSSAPSGLQVLRCKGAIITQDRVYHVLQGVRNLYEISTLAESPEMGVPDTGKIVLIGKGLDDIVRRSLESVFQ